jgi:ribonuclease T
MSMNKRFRGFLPVVADIETGGFNSAINPILELACVILTWENNRLRPLSSHRWAVTPFHGSSIDPASLKFTGINLQDPNRRAVSEAEAVKALFREVREQMKETDCHRAILVAHNAAFDREFLMRAADRNNVKRNPFHPFTTIDTASLSAVAYGHTVLREACARAGIEFDINQAHGALYDADRTAQLFCRIVNSTPIVMED